ncbi:MAG: hypothetical protein KGI54_08365 [Pseudomonadota bacterium]|nr:hypothetical protein [Pseudomonadota bacterium]
MATAPKKTLDPALNNLPEVTAQLPTAEELAAQAAPTAFDHVTDTSSAQSVEDLNGTTVVKW